MLAILCTILTITVIFLTTSLAVYLSYLIDIENAALYSSVVIFFFLAGVITGASCSVKICRIIRIKYQQWKDKRTRTKMRYKF